MKIEPFKMRVTPEQSKQVQEIVFRNGGEWRDHTREVTHTERPFLGYGVRKNTEGLSCWRSEDNGSPRFSEAPVPELTFADFMARYGGVEATQFDIMRKIVAIAEDAHINGDSELEGILLDALGDYIIHNHPQCRA